MEEDPDLLIGDMPSHPPGQTSLGSSLSNQLGDSPNSNDPFSAPPPMSASIDDDDFKAPVEASPIRKRRSGMGSGAPASNRLSLAFELSRAMDDGEGGEGSRILEEEFGIKEEEGEEDDDEAQGDNDGDGKADAVEDAMSKLMGGGTRVGAEEGEERNLPGVHGSSAPSELDSGSHVSEDHLVTPGAKRRGDRSSASPVSGGVRDSPSTPDPDASFQDASTALEENIETTDRFLERLRMSTNEQKEHITKEKMEDQQPKDSNSETVPDGDTGDASKEQGSFVDRQPIIEDLASAIIRSLYDTAKEREAQIRELKDVELAFARAGYDEGWRLVLASLEDLPIVSEEDELEMGFGIIEDEMMMEEEDIDEGDGDDEEPITPTARGRTRGRRGLSVSTDGSEDDYGTQLAPPNQDDELEEGYSTPTHTYRSVLNGPIVANGPNNQENARRRPPPPSVPSRQGLSQLRNTTTSLISTLTHINEATQVHHAASAEAGRKLKHLRGVLGGWRGEMASVERSKEFIEEWEKDEENEGRKGTKGWYGETVMREMKLAEEELGKAGDRAREVLATQSSAEVEEKEKTGVPTAST